MAELKRQIFQRPALFREEAAPWPDAKMDLTLSDQKYLDEKNEENWTEKLVCAPANSLFGMATPSFKIGSEHERESSGEYNFGNFLRLTKYVDTMSGFLVRIARSPIANAINMK